MIKLVFFFNQYESGWSETYYAPGSDPKLFASTLTPTFLQNSVKFRSASTVLKAIRLTRMEPPRFSFLVRPYPTPQGQRASTATEGPDIASTDAVVSLYGATYGTTRRVFMRGLFDGDVVRDSFGVDQLTPQLNQGINLFVKGMISYAFAVKYQTRPPNGGLVWNKIVRIDKHAVQPLWSTFFLSSEVPGYAVGNYLSVNGIPSGQLPGFPRNVPIISKFVLDGISNYTVAYALPGGVSVSPRNMLVTLLVPAYDAIESWQFERYSEHKTGRPFGSLRGRSRSRAVRV